MKEGVALSRPASDEEILRSYGYRQELRRSLNLLGNFGVAFTYLSPVVGFYSLFAFGLSSGGPALILTMPPVIIGQLLVALVFAELGSTWPIAGALYQWGRRLGGGTLGWWVGWIYAWALLVTIPAVDFGGAPYVANAFGVANPSHGLLIIITLILLVIQTTINVIGIRQLVQLVYLGIVVEILGTFGIGILLLFHIHQPFSIIFDTAFVASHGSFWPAFLLAILVPAFIFYGFESAADVSEEVISARARVPRAVILSMVVGALASLFVVLAFTLAIPNVATEMKSANPAVDIVSANLGSVVGNVFSWDVILGFLSCGASIQAAATRVFYSYARDGVVPAARWLANISPSHKTPVNALLMTAVVALLLCLSATFESILTSFAVAGIYLSFQLIMAATLVARARGFKPEGFSLGAWGWPVNLLGLLYGVAMLVHLMQPITPGAPFYVNYEVPLATAGIVLLGVVVYLWAQPRVKAMQTIQVTRPELDELLTD